MLSIRTLVILICVPILATSISELEQKKIDVHQTQMEFRDGIGLKYGENTQTITFALNGSTDFIIKTGDTQEIRATMHTYWRENNIYISSEYRAGQNVKLQIYEDHEGNVLVDTKFYVASGFKFTAQKGRVYIIKMINEGNIGKLIAMQLSKSSSEFENAATSDDYSHLAKKISTVAQEIKGLFSISEFGIIMHQKNSVSVNHSTCLYMTYLMIQAFIVIVIVMLQVKYMTGLLKEDPIV